MAKRLVVFGGNGFLGSRVCKHAVARGWEVTSVSRSGEPKWSTVSSSSTPPPWAHQVSWERADVFQPATYAPLIKGADAVVHSMGILLEADYKRVLSGAESPVAGLRRAFAQSPNPLREGHDREPKCQLTYEAMNRDSAVGVARVASSEGVGAMAYVSAAGGIPVLPARYISTKREAESAIASDFPRLRSLFVRPPFLYDASRAMTVPLAAAVGVGAAFNTVTGGLFGGLLGAAGTKPLKADVVAEAVVEALGDEAVSGVLEPARLEELAEKGWRKGML